MIKILIIHTLLLPLKFLVSLLSLVTWKPYFKIYKSKFDKQSSPSFPSDILEDQIEEIIKDGDGCKFIGIAGHFIPENKAIYNAIYRFFYHDTLIRYPIEYMKPDSNNFSGDMFIGILSFITARYQNGLLTEEEKKKIKPVFDNIILTGKIEHPFKDDVNRGNILSWYTTMPGFAQMIILTKLCYLIYGDNRYNRLYKLLMILSWPISFSYGFCLFLGRVEACNWYSEHTLAWAYYLASLLGIKRFNALLYKQSNRHDYNPEILGLNCLINGGKQEDIDFIKLCLDSYTTNSTDVDDEDMIKEFDLKHFKFVERSKYILPPTNRASCKYMWEKDPLKPKTGNKKWIADYVSLSNIYKEIIK